MSIKNILICGNYLFDEERGGASRVSWELARNLVFKGYKVIFFIRGKKDSSDFEEIDGIKVYRHKNNILKAMKILNYIFKENQIDIVNFHDPYTSLWTTLYMILNFLKIPRLYFFFSPWGTEYYIRAKRKKSFYPLLFFNTHLRIDIERFLLKHSNKILTNSHFMSGELFRIHRLKSDIVPPGVDLDKFSLPSGSKLSLRKKIGFNFAGKIFFTLRNLEPRMGLENLIEAFNILKAKGYKDLLLIIGGTGSLYNELLEKVRKNSLEKIVIFVGNISDEILPLYYQASDAFILPTKELEGFGLVSLEAMSCGIPVLATPVSANIEVVGSFDKSLLFKGIFPEDISQGIVDFLNRKDLNELSLKVRRYAKRFSWKLFADKIEKVFYEMSDM